MSVNKRMTTFSYVETSAREATKMYYEDIYEANQSLTRASVTEALAAINHKGNAPEKGTDGCRGKVYMYLTCRHNSHSKF